MTRLQDERLQQAIWQWDDDEFARDQLAIPSTAAGLCVDASEAFAAYLRDSGSSAEVVDVPGQAHTVVESQGFVIDWTARQLDETADIPVVEPVDVYYARFKEEGLSDVRPVCYPLGVGDRGPRGPRVGRGQR